MNIHSNIWWIAFILNETENIHTELAGNNKIIVSNSLKTETGVNAEADLREPECPCPYFWDYFFYYYIRNYWSVIRAGPLLGNQLVLYMSVCS